MSVVSRLLERLKTDRSAQLAVGLAVLAAVYPLIVETLRDLPVIGDFIPRTGSMVVIMVTMIMALGLNVVVGYAGLLDLGYVAFYAAGAYVAGWLASQQFGQVTLHIGSTVKNNLTGIHVSMWLILILAGVFTTIEPVRGMKSPASGRSCRLSTMKG